MPIQWKGSPRCQHFIRWALFSPSGQCFCWQKDRKKNPSETSRRAIFYPGSHFQFSNGAQGCRKGGTTLHFDFFPLSSFSLQVSSLLRRSVGLTKLRFTGNLLRACTDICVCLQNDGLTVHTDISTWGLSKRECIIIQDWAGFHAGLVWKYGCQDGERYEVHTLWSAFHQCTSYFRMPTLCSNSFLGYLTPCVMACMISLQQNDLPISNFHSSTLQIDFKE